jgi:1-deoxy-D-xylulose-5-phosphate reductoisomerase
MVQFADGSIKAQLGMPDMKLPIQYAFTYPDRLKTNFPRFDFNLCSQFTFERPDLERFRNLSYAYYAMERGGNMPCILNAANEVVVAAFLKDQIGFLQMSDIIEDTMAKAEYIAKPTYDDYVNTDKFTRIITNNFIQNNKQPKQII